MFADLGVFFELTLRSTWFDSLVPALFLTIAIVFIVVRSILIASRRGLLFFSFLSLCYLFG